MRAKAGLLPVAAALVTVLAGVSLKASVARAEDDCLTAPNAAAPPGSHWYYHEDRATQRKCWHVRPKDQAPPEAAAQEQPEAATPAEAASSGVRTPEHPRGSIRASGKPRAGTAARVDPPAPAGAETATWPDPPAPANAETCLGRSPRHQLAPAKSRRPSHHRFVPTRPSGRSRHRQPASAKRRRLSLHRNPVPTPRLGPSRRRQPLPPLRKRSPRTPHRSFPRHPRRPGMARAARKRRICRSLVRSRRRRLQVKRQQGLS